MSTQDTKYNGWANYATWRVNLEIVDDYIASLEPGELTFADLIDFSDYLADYVTDLVTSGFDDRLPIRWYAEAFLDQVNWYEIAATHASDCEGVVITGR